MPFAINAINQNHSMRVITVKIMASRLFSYVGVAMSHIYNMQAGSWGYTNCDLCDDDVLCNEYLRDDGLVQWLCKQCEDRLHL